ncbi:MAG TPA: glycosyltransferase family 39 protein [Gemmatimonadales bacterium]|nr:glycosyltransferase family 39 protein [Gemmatimonadales bacterium]
MVLRRGSNLQSESARALRLSPLALAIVLLAASLAVRLILISHRWLNPDEGAHLMDGVLILDGLRPIRDFGSRQVLYSFLQAVWLGLFGETLFAGRLLAVLASIGVGALVYGITRRLSDSWSAVVATALYAWFPHSILWSANVHLQPLTLLFACGAFFVLAGMLDAPVGRARPFLAGLWFGLGFYIRESTLAYLAAGLLFVVVLHLRRPRVAARQALWVFAGFATVVLAACAAYLQYLPLDEVWASQLNPLSLPFRLLGTMIGHLGAAAPPVGVGSTPGRYEQQPIPVALHNLEVMLSFSWFLWLLVAWSPFVVRWRRDPGPSPAAGFDWTRLALPWCWLGLLTAAYAVWFAKLGFYPQYFTEFGPPLAIVAGIVVVRAVSVVAVRRVPGWAVLLVALAFPLAFWLGRVAQVSSAVYLGACAAALALAIAGAAATPRARWAVAGGVVLLGAVTIGAAGAAPALARLGKAGVAAVGVLGGLALVWRATGNRRKTFNYAVLAVALGLGLTGFDNSGRRLDLGYGCVWRAEVVTPVANLIERVSKPGDQVLSGAVTWALDAGRRPYLNISHPLGFLIEMTVQERADIAVGLVTRPPRIVVLDGYTERTFERKVPMLGSIVARDYELMGTFPDAGEFPVRVYRRSRSARPVPD